mmetsp:Transcript_16913/g.53657  ORF Transcript_16913/g.53657 Transcript_16913/m.53657 type:complete len:239 (-) Transcript_16913:298-1014(-)
MQRELIKSFVAIVVDDKIAPRRLDVRGHLGVGRGADNLRKKVPVRLVYEVSQVLPGPPHGHVVEADGGQVLLVELPVGRALFAEVEGPAHLGPDHLAPFLHFVLADPVIPVRLGPRADELVHPHLAPHHPPQPREEVGAVHSLGVADEADLAVVIPARHGEERGVSVQDLGEALEVVEEVHGDLHVVLEDEHEGKARAFEQLAEGEAVVRGDSVVCDVLLGPLHESAHKCSLPPWVEH